MPNRPNSLNTTTTTKLERNHEHILLLPHRLVPGSLIAAFLGLVSYILWYTLNSNSGIRFAVSWQGKSLIAWELQNTAPDWKDMQKLSDDNKENSGW